MPAGDLCNDKNNIDYGKEKAYTSDADLAMILARLDHKAQALGLPTLLPVVQRRKQDGNPTSGGNNG